MTHREVLNPRAAHDGLFPEGAPLEEQTRFMLNYAVLAPSVLNTQPWRFTLAGRDVKLYADRSRGLPALDPDGRELVISCGAALLNLRLAVRHYGYAESWVGRHDEGDPDLLAVLSVGEPTPAGRDEEALFGAIPRRETERRPFADLDVAPAILGELREEAAAEGAHLHVFDQPAQKAGLAELVGESIRRLAANPAAAHDLSAWLRADDDPRHDGVHDERQNPWGHRSSGRTRAADVAAGTVDLASDSPALLLLSTRADDRAAWLAAGQALERVLLRATLHDLSASYLNQPTEVPEVRSRLVTAVGGAFPQVLFRIGHPLRTAGTLRRRVRDVIGPG
jgi:hypothetical protein